MIYISLDIATFIPRHETSLGDLLEVWSNMVGAGEWEMGEEGPDYLHFTSSLSFEI